MQLLTRVGDDLALMPRELAHYDLVVPLIENSFAGSPIVYKSYPNGVEKDGIFKVTPFPLFAHRLLWLVTAKYAVEFYTWAPLSQDEDRLRFARILLEPTPGVTYERLKRAALAVRSVLHDTAGLEPIAMLDGGSGIALWVPLADAPHATPLRAWLHALANRVAALYPDLVSTEHNTHRDARVHVHVSSNAPGRYSALPYSLRAQALRVCTPVLWSELDAVSGADAFGIDDIPKRLREHGDIFAMECARLARQRFADVAQSSLMTTSPAPRGHIIVAAVGILSDGKPRTSQEILAEALDHKLVPPATLNKYVYSALIEYIARQLGRGRKPPIVQDAQRRFRINEPPDDWPDLAPLPEHPADEAVQALCDRLETTATGDDPAAFEAAVCDAFGHLGFLTQHLGDRAQPDGIADAILGPLGYRVLIECKTAKSGIPRPDPVEVAKFRDEFKADRCVMVGPQFPDEIEFLNAMRAHRVTAMALPELQTLLHLGANALEVKGVLEPGYACDAISDFLWERSHGAAKHVTTTAYLIEREGWKAQLTAAAQGGPATAPHLTADAAMLVVDEALRAAGSTQTCTLDDVTAAFSYLSSPDVARATIAGGSLVVLDRRG
jgi:hypothetical protein